MNETDPKRLKEAAFKVSQIEANVASLPESVRAKAPEFFKSVPTRAAAIGLTIQRMGCCSDAQMQALDNMLHGLRKWTHGDDA